MPKEVNWETPDIVPSLVYGNLARAAEWLERVFGFRERVDSRLTWAGGGMTWLDAGSGLINITTPTDARDPNAASRSAIVQRVYVDDIDAHYRRSKKEGAAILSDLQRDSGAAAFIPRLTTSDTSGSFRSAASIWLLTVGSPLPESLAALLNRLCKRGRFAPPR